MKALTIWLSSDEFVQLRTVTISFVMSVRLCPSVCPHETTRFPLDGFSRNLKFENFFKKIFRQNSFFIKIQKE